MMSLNIKYGRLYIFNSAVPLLFYFDVFLFVPPYSTKVYVMFCISMHKINLACVCANALLFFLARGLKYSSLFLLHLKSVLASGA